MATTTSEKRASEVRPDGESLSLDAFSSFDWLLLAGCALMWGSSFILIEEALEAFPPPVIAFVRVVLGAATLVSFPAARRKVARADLPALGLLGLLWMAGPFLLFPVAQQWIDSSLAGMINGGVPVFATLISITVVRRAPTTAQLAGVAVGFVGIVAVGWPVVQGSRATLVGVLLVGLATFSYGIALNIAVPLQRRYGSLPVLLRAQLAAIALTVVPAAVTVGDARFEWNSAAALIPLGCLGTALAFVAMTTLVGRVGAARGSIAVYFVPIVAIVLGAGLRNESIALLSILGTALVILGAVLAGRGAARSSQRTSG